MSIISKKKPKVKLTKKQQAFIVEYIKDTNATQAAIRAGYSENSANVIGHENLTKPYIKEAIDKQLKKMFDNRIASSTEVMEFLTRVLRKEEKEMVLTRIKRKEVSYDDKGRRIETQTEDPTVIEISPKNNDAIKAAELIGKRYALFTEKVEVDYGLDKLDEIIKGFQNEADS